ncbi:MAG: iron-sulfur cluster assembly accessory protein [Verrucomicrobiota bacterium]
MIEVTEAAATQIKELVPDEKRSSEGLRIFVKTGGCSGLQYAMTIAPPEAEDHITDAHGVQVYLDQEGQKYLQGSVIDFSDDLVNTGFRIQNPNAKQTCGCGTSFEA